MNTKVLFNILLAITTLTLLASCKKDYRSGGEVSDPNVNMTTYDFLKSKPQFSSLVTLIDRAGLKETINEKTTFFATTNYGVDEYLKAMKNIRAIELNDENITYTLDSIPLWRLDSLKTYIFDGAINRKDITVKGNYYPSFFGTIPNVRFRINMDRIFQYTNYVDYVDYVVYSKVIGTLDEDEPDASQIPDEEVDKVTYCQTSGIVTTNGIVHVLDGYHRLFYNNDKID